MALRLGLYCRHQGIVINKTHELTETSKCVFCPPYIHKVWDLKILLSGASQWLNQERHSGTSDSTCKESKVAEGGEISPGLK